MESRVKFLFPQNIPGDSEQNSVALFSAIEEAGERRYLHPI